MRVIQIFRQLSDQTVADFGKQLAQGLLKSLDFEPASYRLECAIVKRKNVMAGVTACCRFVGQGNNFDPITRLSLYEPSVSLCNCFNHRPNFVPAAKAPNFPRPARAFPARPPALQLFGPPCLLLLPTIQPSRFCSQWSHSRIP